MAVHQSKRSESSLEFLKELRDLEVYIIKRSSVKPKKYKFFLAEHFLNPAAKAYSLAKMGNTVYPSTPEDVALRRKYMYESICHIQSLIGQIEVFYAVFRDDGLSKCEMEELSRRLFRADVLMKCVLKRDRERYKNIK